MRDIKQLNPKLQAVIPSFITDCKAHGLIVGIGECYRTIAEQEALYAKGRTTGTKGAIVTNCRGTSFSSPHQWGVAFDFFRNDGKGLFEDGDGWFAKVGATGVKHGLEWGGNWTQGWVDKPHMQLAKFFRDGTVGYLKATYGTPDKFMATWGKNPVIPAPTSATCDTTQDIILTRGGSYQFKVTSATAPKVNLGGSGAAVILPRYTDGNDHFYYIVGVGDVGTAVGLYVNDVKQFVAHIK